MIMYEWEFGKYICTSVNMQYDNINLKRNNADDMSIDITTKAAIITRRRKPTHYMTNTRILFTIIRSNKHAISVINMIKL